MIQATSLAGMMLVADIIKFTYMYGLYDGPKTLVELWQEVSDRQGSDLVLIKTRDHLFVLLQISTNMIGEVEIVDGRYQLTESGRDFVERQAEYMNISLKKVPGFAGLEPNTLIKLTFLVDGPLTAQAVADSLTKVIVEETDGQPVTRAQVLEALKPAVNAGYVIPVYQKRGDTLYKLSDAGSEILDAWIKECEVLGFAA